MTTFNITIQPKRDNYWPIVWTWQADGPPIGSEEKLQLDIAVLISQVNPLLYGKLLGQALFHGVIANNFNQALYSNPTTPLQFWLTIDDPELKTLHWQRLCCFVDGRWKPLCFHHHVWFSRYIVSPITPYSPMGRRDMRALVVVANPTNLSAYQLNRFDAETITHEIKTALGDIPYDVLSTPSLKALLGQLAQQRYTLLHWVSHGKYDDKQQDTLLYLSDEANEVAPITASKLIEKLSNVRQLPYFIFLSACESASSPNSAKALDGFAQRLVYELGMPAVLGMADLISVDTARQLATNFYQRLRAQTEQRLYIDQVFAEAIAGLSEHSDITIPTLYQRLGSLPLFDDSLDKALTSTDIAHGLQRLPDLIQERAPILAADFEAVKTIIDRYNNTHDTALLPADKLARDEALRKLNVLCESTFDLSFNALALNYTPPRYDSRCPFLGLHAFDATNANFFFGRDALIQQLHDHLQNRRGLVVLGPSGSGKSSLVLAGLVPRLQQNTPGLRLVYLTPKSNPLQQLEIALQSVAEQAKIVVIDQFEEAFTLCTNDSERQEFFNKLLTLAQELPLILTMRVDFLGDCANYPELNHFIEHCLKNIGPMNHAELLLATQQQTQAVNLQFEEGLSGLILEEVQTEPGKMPLLQHALRVLWERRHGRWLRLTEYRELGGVKKAIAHTADAFYYNHDQLEQRQQIRAIFTRLIHLGETPGDGETYRDTRQRVPLIELVSTEHSLEATRALVHRLVDARLLMTTVDPISKVEWVEVAHEALIRHWDTLQAWLKEDRPALQIRVAVQQAADKWDKNQRSDNDLAHKEGNRLVEAEMLLVHPNIGLNDLEIEYLDRCITRAKQPQYISRKVKGVTLQRLIISPNLYILCEYVLLKCNEFDTHALLRHLFSLPRLKFFREGLPYADNKTDRVNAVINYLLPITTIEGNSAFIWLLDELLQQRSEEDLLYLKLDIIRNGVQQALQGQAIISATLYRELKEILLESEIFNRYDYLFSIFMDDRIFAWQNELPKMDTLALQVEATVNYLLEVENENKQNGLILFLQVLTDLYPPFSPQQTKLTHIIRKLVALFSQTVSGQVDTSKLLSLRSAYKLDYIAKVNGFSGIPSKLRAAIIEHLYNYDILSDITLLKRFFKEFFWTYSYKLPYGDNLYERVTLTIDYLVREYQQNNSTDLLITFVNTLYNHQNKQYAKSILKSELVELTNAIKSLFIKQSLEVGIEYGYFKTKFGSNFENYRKIVEQKTTIRPQFPLPYELQQALKTALVETDVISKPQLLASIFNNPQLIYWREKIPQRVTSDQQAIALINYFYTQQSFEGAENGLVLLLIALKNEVHVNDIRYYTLQNLVQVITNFIKTGNYSDNSRKLLENKLQFNEGIIKGIPSRLILKYRNTLLKSHSPKLQDLTSIFYYGGIEIWKYTCPSNNTSVGQADVTIDYLTLNYNLFNKNGLVLLLKVLSDQHHPMDKLHHDFKQLASELEPILAWHSPDLYPPQKLHQARIRLEHDYKAQLSKISKRDNLPPQIYTELYNVFRKCDEFQDFRRLRSLFIDSRLIAWRSKLPEAEYMEEQIEWTIEFLFRSKDFTGYDGLRILRRVLLGENGLVLLLIILSERYEDMNPELRKRLLLLADEVDKLIDDTGLSEADIPTLEELLK